MTNTCGTLMLMVNTHLQEAREGVPVLPPRQPPDVPPLDPEPPPAPIDDEERAEDAARVGVDALWKEGGGEGS